MKKVLMLGPGHPLRGGLAAFNERLANEFIREGHQAEIVTFSLQYPSLLFPGKTQLSNQPAPLHLRIRVLVNSINPFNWIKTGNRLRKERPDIIVVRFWLPFMGPCLGTILRIAKKNRHTKVVCILDNVVPHEKRPGDKILTRYFLPACDGFISMSENVLNDLRVYEKQKPAVLIPHPLFDSFGALVEKKQARTELGLPQGKLLLFFGFIRKYKGLDLLLEAMASEPLKRQNVKLLIAGEFYEDDKPYRQLIKKRGLEESVILHDHFIPDDQVRYYMCAADCVVQPYRTATQSGVTPLAYHFERPMIVTKAGGLPDLVADGKSGLVAEIDAHSIAKAIEQFYQLGEEYFIPHLREEKKKYAWSQFTKAILQLAEELPATH